MRVEDEVIDRSAEEGARVVALALLSDANEAADRLARGEDEEALHDFRVALRRLRTTLRAFRPWLEENVSRRLEKRLRRCARATNAARDAEVQQAWLEGKRDALPTKRQRVGFELLVERVEHRRREAEDAERLLARFRRVSEKLERRLGSYERRVERAGTGTGPSLGGVLATFLGDQLDVLCKRLDAIEGALDENAVHRARIEAKRLRYLLEPLRGNRHADSREATKSLKRLQDVLGELHDSHVFAGEVREALVDAAGARARELHRAVYERGSSGAALRECLQGNPRPGLLALARLVRERRDALYADLEREWRGGGIEALSLEVQAVASALELRAGGKLERERKYVLAGLPPRAAESPPLEILQGWLPGTRLRERIRCLRDAQGERYWRGLKQGAPRSRLEAEEETTREVFETLWPLTEGRRIAKRRRKVKDGGLTWEIDEFTDRQLWLAEVELSARSGEVALPDWLRPLVLRDVTDDPAYLNENLATQPRGRGPAVATPSGSGLEAEGVRAETDAPSPVGPH